MGKEQPLRSYRVQANVGPLRHGEIVEIDPTDEGWSRYLEAGYLVAVDEAGEPVEGVADVDA